MAAYTAIVHFHDLQTSPSKDPPPSEGTQWNGVTTAGDDGREACRGDTGPRKATPGTEGQAGGAAGRAEGEVSAPAIAFGDERATPTGKTETGGERGGGGGA